MTTNEIIGFSYVLIAVHQSQYVIIIFLKDELIQGSQIFKGIRLLDLFSLDTSAFLR